VDDPIETAKLDISFVRFSEPHFGHTGVSPEKTRSSLFVPQSLQEYSKSAISAILYDKRVDFILLLVIV